MGGKDTMFYTGGRPNRLGKAINGLWARLGEFGLVPKVMSTVEVPGRKSGKPVTFPIVVTRYEDADYLVSMLGENTNWVANVRAAEGKVTISRGKRRAAVLEEVPVEERASILKAFLQIAPGGRPHIPVDKDAPVEAFEAVASEYPVFRAVWQ